MKNMGGSRKTSPLYKTYTVNTLATTIKIFLIPYLDFSLLKYICFCYCLPHTKACKPTKALCLIDQQAKTKLIPLTMMFYYM